MNRRDKHRHLKIFIFPPISFTFATLRVSEAQREEKKSTCVGEKIQSLAIENVRSFSFMLMAMNFFKRKNIFRIGPFPPPPLLASRQTKSYTQRKIRRDENPIYFFIAVKKLHHQDESRKWCCFCRITNLHTIKLQMSRNLSFWKFHDWKRLEKSRWEGEKLQSISKANLCEKWESPVERIQDGILRSAQSGESIDFHLNLLRCLVPLNLWYCQYYLRFAYDASCLIT